MKQLMFLTSIFLALFSIQSWAVSPYACEGLIGNCEYYRCRESIQPCGEDGYFIHFGYRYCKQFFTELSPNVSEREQQWLERVGACLQRKVDEIPIYQSCSNTEDAAIYSHTECYVQTGFCAMPYSLRFRLLGIVYEELKDKRMIETLMNIIKRCDLPEMKKTSVKEAEELIP
jgi:hypothetical protein